MYYTGHLRPCQPFFLHFLHFFSFFLFLHPHLFLLYKGTFSFSLFFRFILDIARFVCYSIVSCEKYEKCDWRDSSAIRQTCAGDEKSPPYLRNGKVGERGQIVIPKDARELYGIHPGDTLLILGDEENGMIVTKPDVLSSLAERILDQIGKEGAYP